jgi:hypothetical protein
MTPEEIEQERLATIYGDGAGHGLDKAFHTFDPDPNAAEGEAGSTRFSVAAKAVTDADIRCTGEVQLGSGKTKRCGRLLAKLAGRPWLIECSRCHAVNRSATTP